MREIPEALLPHETDADTRTPPGAGAPGEAEESSGRGRHLFSQHADRLRNSANELSLTRALGGMVVGGYIAASAYPATWWGPAIAAAGLAITDAADGWLARKAAKADGKTSRAGAWIDQLTDKVFTLGLTAGIAIASTTNGRPAVGAVIATAGAVMLGRDIYVTRKRVQAERQALPVTTAAKRHGKIKTLAQCIALVGLASPLMESQAANWWAAGALAGSALLSIHSAWQYRTLFNNANSAARNRTRT